MKLEAHSHLNSRHQTLKDMNINIQSAYENSSKNMILYSLQHIKHHFVVILI